MNRSSIFDLKRRKEDLDSSNHGMANIKYDQITPLRNIGDSGTSFKFGNGIITYRWHPATGKWWLPSRSYFKTTYELSKGDGSVLTKSDNIAPNMGACSTLFQKLQYKINDKTLSEITEHVSQVDSNKTRHNKSANWMSSTGNNLNFWESSFEKRQQQIIENGGLIDNLGGSDVEITDQTNLGFTNTSTMIISAAGHLLTVTNSPDLRTILKSGDILVIKLAADVFTTAFYVVNVISSTVAQMASFGTTLGGDYPAAAALFSVLTLERYRYSECDNVIVTDNLVTQPSTVNNNVITYNAGDNRNLKLGDIALIAANASTLYQGEVINQQLTALTSNGSSFNVQTNVAANAANFFSALRYEDTELTDLSDLGYVQSAAAALGHAVNIAVGTSSALLTITKLGATTDIPDVNLHFKKGDIITVILQAGPLFQGLILEVDPSSNGRSLLVIGEQVLGAVKGDATDARNYLLKRLRLGGPKYKVNKARKVKSNELIWVPPLSIFGVNHAIPGSSKHELQLTPFSNTFYQKNFIQSIIADKTHGAANDFKLLITRMDFYACMVDGPQIKEDEFYLDLNETRCQINTVSVPERSQYALDVSPSTNGFTVAFQDEAAESNTLYSQSMFKIRNDEELNLTNFYIRYAGEQKPQPDFEPIYDEEKNQDNMVELYARSVMYNGGYYDDNTESLKEFYDRGLYMYFPFPKTGSDRETRAYVSTQFSALTGTPRILLFNHFKKVCILKYKDSQLVEVILNEV